MCRPSNELLAALALLQSLTPLSADCGQVCGRRCCRPSAESSGMRLFPGEAALLREAAGRGDGFQINPADGGLLLTCPGTCDRRLRPLACRFFPLFPYVDAAGRVRAVYDPRAFRLCPLVRQRAHVPLRRDFVRAVRRAGRILMGDSACAAFLRENSRELDTLWRLLPDSGRAPIARRSIHP